MKMVSYQRKRLSEMSKEELFRFVTWGQYSDQDVIDLHDDLLKLRADEKASVVHHPAHHTAGKVECIDAIEAATTGIEGIQAVCTANVIKYVWRWRRKNGVEDLCKARWYLDKLIGRARVEGDGNDA